MNMNQEVERDQAIEALGDGFIRAIRGIKRVDSIIVVSAVVGILIVALEREADRELRKLLIQDVIKAMHELRAKLEGLH